MNFDVKRMWIGTLMKLKDILMQNKYSLRNKIQVKLTACEIYNLSG